LGKRGPKSIRFRPLIDTWSSSLLQSEEACPQDLNVDVMQERRQLVLSVSGDGFS